MADVQATLRLDDLVRAVVTATAPAQLGLLDEAAAAWEAGDLAEEAGRPGQWHGGAVGSGLVWGAVANLAFPVISGALAQAAGDQLQQTVRRWRDRRRGRRDRWAAVPVGQAEAVRAAVVDRALHAGLGFEAAAAMGDAVYVEMVRAAAAAASSGETR